MQIVAKIRPGLCVWRAITLLLTLVLSVELVMPIASFAQQISNPASTGDGSLMNQELPPMQQAETVHEHKPYYKKWWVWTIAGVVVAGAAAGAALAMGGGNDSAPTGSVTITGPAPR